LLPIVRRRIAVIMNARGVFRAGVGEQQIGREMERLRYRR